MTTKEKLAGWLLYTFLIWLLAVGITDIIRKDTPYEYQQETRRRFEEVKTEIDSILNILEIDDAVNNAIANRLEKLEKIKSCSCSDGQFPKIAVEKKPESTRGGWWRFGL